MIKFVPALSGIVVEQWCEAPAVYFDHWALRRISEDLRLASEFAAALVARRGTWAVSWINLVEFCRVTDADQRKRADALLDLVFPRIFFLYPNFYKVVEAEERMQVGSLEAAHADMVTLREFVKLNLLRHDSLELMPPQRLFQLIPQTHIAARFDGFADSVANEIRIMKEHYAKDADFRRRVKGLPSASVGQHGTRVIAGELLGAILSPGQRLEKSDAVDVCHAIVAVSYCDFVLLDGRWAAQVDLARKRIRQAGMSFPVAEVFSERANGLRRFLDRLRLT